MQLGDILIPQVVSLSLRLLVRKPRARRNLKCRSFYMTYQAKQAQDFPSINYGSVPVSVADNQPPTIHLFLSSLCHSPYMHMYNMNA